MSETTTPSETLEGTEVAGLARGPLGSAVICACWQNVRQGAGEGDSVTTDAQGVRAMPRNFTWRTVVLEERLGVT